jgi:hypothetical protein
LKRLEVPLRIGFLTVLSLVAERMRECGAFFLLIKQYTPAPTNMITPAQALAYTVSPSGNCGELFGAAEGANVGEMLGDAEGANNVGELLGVTEGSNVDNVGELLGANVGLAVGDDVGDDVGGDVGDDVGGDVGDDVGVVVSGGWRYRTHKLPASLSLSIVSCA